MNASRTWASACVVIGLSAGTAGALNIETVSVGNPGNTGEWAGQGYGGYGPNRICGSVDYVYAIGKYEVTAGQYTEFLNAVAKTDTYGLYSGYMNAQIDAYGCNIKRTGTAGNYGYNVAADWADRPVNFVSWGDAARFANWMHNGQPSGPQNAMTTEDGSYSLDGATSNTALLAVTRKANATWVIPSEDEWYKAAFYDPAKPGGAGYWDYATRNNMPPSNVLDNDGLNNANFTIFGQDGYGSYAYTIGAPYYRTEVGVFAGSSSGYGTFDQCGNVHEWNEAVIISYRSLRGGSFYDQVMGAGINPTLHAAYRNYALPANETSNKGFRIAYIPEPATFLLLGLGGLTSLRRCPGFSRHRAGN